LEIVSLDWTKIYDLRPADYTTTTLLLLLLLLLSA